MTGKRGEYINFQIPAHLKARLKTQADSLGMTLSDFARSTLTDYSGTYVRNANKTPKDKASGE